MSDLKKLQALSLFEWWLLIASASVLPLVAMLLKLRGFRRTEKMLSALSKPLDDDGEQIERVRVAARMVSIAANKGLFTAQCLEQAITLWWFLGLMGIDSSIRFGIYKQDEKVEAHAWVHYGEEVMIGQLDRLDDFTPILDVTIDRNRGND